MCGEWSGNKIISFTIVHKSPADVKTAAVIDKKRAATSIEKKKAAEERREKKKEKIGAVELII